VVQTHFYNKIYSKVLKKIVSRETITLKVKKNGNIVVSLYSTHNILRGKFFRDGCKIMCEEIPILIYEEISLIFCQCKYFHKFSVILAQPFCVTIDPLL
jgi:hypothetical protein